MRYGKTDDFICRGLIGIDNKRSSSAPNSIEVTGSLKELKIGEWREKIKKRTLYVNSGKHTGRIGRFCSWQGSRAWVRFEGDLEKTCLPLDHSVSILM